MIDDLSITRDTSRLMLVQIKAQELESMQAVGVSVRLRRSFLNDHLDSEVCSFCRSQEGFPQQGILKVHPIAESLVNENSNDTRLGNRRASSTG